MPGATTSVLVTTSKALVTRSDALVTTSVFCAVLNSSSRSCLCCTSRDFRDIRMDPHMHVNRRHHRYSSNPEMFLVASSFLLLLVRHLLLLVRHLFLLASCS